MKNPFKSSYTSQELEMFSFLAKIPLFENLTAKEKSYFLPYMHERNFKKDEAVFFRDDPSHALYIIKSGMVELNIDINKGLEMLELIGRGRTTGENCLIKNSRRHYNSIVKSESATIYVIPQDSIFFIFENHIQVRVKMLESLAEINNQYHSSLMKVYKSSLGFFNLAQVFAKAEKK